MQYLSLVEKAKPCNQDRHLAHRCTNQPCIVNDSVSQGVQMKASQMRQAQAPAPSSNGWCVGSYTGSGVCLDLHLPESGGPGLSLEPYVMELLHMFFSYTRPNSN